MEFERKNYQIIAELKAFNAKWGTQESNFPRNGEADLRGVPKEKPEVTETHRGKIPL